MQKKWSAALAACVIVATAFVPAMAQQLDSRIDNSRRDGALCHGADPDKAIAACGNLIRSAGDIVGLTGAETSSAGNNPVVADATITRAANYLKKGRFDDAISDCTRVISFLPNIPDCYGIRAAALAGKNLDDSALADAEKGVAVDPGNAGMLVTRGQVYEKIGAKDEAIADYRKAIQLDPNLSPARLGLVRLGAP